MLGDTHQRGEIARRQAALLPDIEDQQPLFRRHRRLWQRLGLDQPPSLALARTNQPRPPRLLERFLREGLFVEEGVVRPDLGGRSARELFGRA